VKKDKFSNRMQLFQSEHTRGPDPSVQLGIAWTKQNLSKSISKFPLVSFKATINSLAANYCEMAKGELLHVFPFYFTSYEGKSIHLSLVLVNTY
jgi:hypothetical protein